jgi:16S rRNA (guanine527-N7)-methyltransferase
MDDDFYNIDMWCFEKYIDELDIGISTLSDRQKDQFHMYYELLVQWNSFFNLTAITEFQDVIIKHFVDSISLVKWCWCEEGMLTEASIIDVGTGAGFPGVPMKIIFPDLKITLLDSLGKRIEFLNYLVNELGLSDTPVVHCRAEDIARREDMREQFDICVSRAVANLTVLSEYCLPFLKLGGHFLALKTIKSSPELLDAESAIKILGGTIVRRTSFYLPSSDISRSVFGIRKDRPTPDQYPRKAGIPKKRPLK